MTASDTVYAWLVREANGEEGIVGGVHPLLGTIQLVSGIDRVAQKMRPLALAHRERTGKPVRLVRFTGAETVEEL